MLNRPKDTMKWRTIQKDTKGFRLGLCRSTPATAFVCCKTSWRNRPCMAQTRKMLQLQLKVKKVESCKVLKAIKANSIQRYTMTLTWKAQSHDPPTGHRPHLYDVHAEVPMRFPRIRKAGPGGVFDLPRPGTWPCKRFKCSLVPPAMWPKVWWGGPRA